MVTNGFHNPTGVTAGFAGPFFPGGISASTDTLGLIECVDVARGRPRFLQKVNDGKLNVSAAKPGNCQTTPGTRTRIPCCVQGFQ